QAGGAAWRAVREGQRRLDGDGPADAHGGERGFAARERGARGLRATRCAQGGAGEIEIFRGVGAGGGGGRGEEFGAGRGRGLGGRGGKRDWAYGGAWLFNEVNRLRG